MRYLVAALSLLLLTGCASLSQDVAKGKLDLGTGAVEALQGVKQAIAPLIGVVGQDAAATRAWATSNLGPSGKNPDPLKYQLALACPMATDAVAGQINGTIDSLIAKIQEATSSGDPQAPQGYLMLFLTKLKYGPPSQDIKAQIADLRAQLALQTDALFTGCQHLFPKKQVNDVLVKLGKAGIIGVSGGSLAPVMGLLP